MYRKLKKAEEVNNSLKEIADRFIDDLEEFEKLPGYSEIVIGEIPQIDIKKYQEDLILQYEKNPVLSNALSGNQGIEESLQEASDINRGIRKFLPRRIDSAHNQRLDYIGELVSYPCSLRSRGILFPDNIITGSIESFVVSQALFYATMGNSAKIPDYLFIGGVMGIIGGIALNMDRFLLSDLSKQEAKYLDTKFDEIFIKQY